ncbi:MAG: alkaline phosphatase family protein, partial [Acidimicrobiales bacterium]
WEQLQDRASLAPTLAAMSPGRITSVAPTTTATALTSIATGRPPSEHGIVGYRLSLGGGRVMNVLRWRAAGEDARESVPPATFQPLAAFGGLEVPVVTRAEFAATGFTLAHLGGARLAGWRMPSTLVVEVSAALAAGEPFVYAYYDGIDKVAHEHGLGPHYEAELSAADRLVSDVVERLPAGACLVVTSDHGQVDVGSSTLRLDEEVLGGDVELQSGEARFRWLHARPGRADALRSRLAEAYGELAWVATRQELVEAGVFGGPLRESFAERLGDVALLARGPVAFVDPSDGGEVKLVSRHGSLTPAEMWVPLGCFRA